MKLSPIKPQNQYKSKPYTFQVADLEARDWIDFVVGGFYDGDTYIEFRHLDEFIEIIYTSPKALNIFCHFGGGYDFLFILQALLENKIKIGPIIPRGSSILSFTVIGQYKVHTFRDSSAILPFSLKKLTHDFNVETKKGEYDHSLNRGYNQDLADYLKSDCLGLFQVLDKYFNSDLIRKVGASTTIASQAQKIFRSYLTEEIFSLPQAHNDFCREACHGGRTEIFRPIGKKINVYDVNSLYPSVMRDNYYPSGRSINTKTFKPGKLGIYKVKVIAPKMYLPIIPTKINNKLIFPTGEFTTSITSEEIEYAETLGYKFEIIEGVYFTQKTKYFEKFISDMYSKRQQATNSVDNIICKLIMNSSYGKFLIKIDRENITFEPELNSKYFQHLFVNGFKIELHKVKVELNSYVNTAIGAFILAYARLKMHKLMLPIQDTLYYSDTDSIHTTSILKSSSELGELKLENPEKINILTGLKEKSKLDYYEHTAYLQPKTYIGENHDFKKVIMKGFDARKIQNFTFDQFRDHLKGEFMIAVKHDKTISKFKSAIKNNKLLVHKKSHDKQIRSKYDKRIINLKNNTSIPLDLKLG